MFIFLTRVFYRIFTIKIYCLLSFRDVHFIIYTLFLCRRAEICFVFLAVVVLVLTSVARRRMKNFERIF